MSDEEFRRYTKKLINKGHVLSFSSQFTGSGDDTDEHYYKINDNYDLARAKWYLNPIANNMRFAIAESMTPAGRIKFLSDLKAIQAAPNSYVRIYRAGDPIGIKSWTWDTYDVRHVFFGNHGRNRIYTGKVKWGDGLMLISYENEIIVSSSKIHGLKELSADEIKGLA